MYKEKELDRGKGIAIRLRFSNKLTLYIHIKLSEKREKKFRRDLGTTAK